MQIKQQLLSALNQYFEELGKEKTYWIAYSGGLDSHVLLSLCHQLPISCRAIHINHGLSTHASEWASHCARVCENLNIPFIQQNLQLKQERGASLEALAREKRYSAIIAHMSAHDVLLTAHQKDDQAETLLMQLMRGAGLKGLAAMPAVKVFAKGYHARPLLPFSRATLEQYAIQQGLNWIEDESNHNTQFARNFIRHQVAPLLASRWPSMTNALARSAEHCAEAQVLLEDIALDDYQHVQGSQANTLSCAKLLQLTAARQRLVLRYWIQLQGFLLPNLKKLEAVRQFVLLARQDRNPCVLWQGAEVRRYRDNLYLMRPLQQMNLPAKVSWNFQQQALILPGLGRLEASLSRGRGLRLNHLPITVCFRQGGELLAIPKRGRLSLKNILQEYAIPPWERSRIPLIFAGDHLIAIPGYFAHEDYQVKADEAGWVLECRVD